MAGCNLSPLRVWRIVRKLGLTYQKPTKRYIEADEKKRKRWIKYELPEIINTAKQYKAMLYFEDESRISLSPVLGKTWSPKGKTPIQKITGKRGSISAISAISKRGKLLKKEDNDEKNNRILPDSIYFYFFDVFCNRMDNKSKKYFNPL